MKTFLSFLLVLFSWQMIFSQGLLVDSIPILITDTNSINDNFIIPFYSQSTDSIPIFYEKRSTYSDTASIWCRNLRSLSPEKIFLHSGNGIIFRNPMPDDGNILWCESNFQGQFDIYGFQYDDSFNIIDTFRLTNDTNIELSIAYESYLQSIFWIQKEDSLLISQNYMIYSDSIHFNSKDTIDNKCISLFQSEDDLLYTKLVNDSIFLYDINNYFNDTSGNIIGVNSTLSSMFGSFLWQNGDSIFTFNYYFGNVSIIINLTSSYCPSFPSPYSFMSGSKFTGYQPTLLTYTIPDSTNIIAISPTYSNWNNKSIFYEDYNSNYLEAFGYKFPQEYEIKYIKNLHGYYDSNFDIIYITFRVLKGTSERIYFMKYKGPVSGNIYSNNINHSKFTIFPNPSTGNFSIKLNEIFNVTQLTISNTTGQTIKTIPLDKGQTIYQFKEKLPPGVYLVGVDSEKGSVVKKLIVNE